MAIAAMVIVPLTSWYMSMAKNTDDLQTQMTMQQIIKDKWDEIHAETFEDLASALAAKPSPWTEILGENGKWKLTTTIGGIGKYANATCTTDAPGSTDRRCRQVAIEIEDTQTGKKQAVDLAKVDSEYFNSRIKAMENSISTLNSSVSSLSSTVSAMDRKLENSISALSSISSNISSINGKFNDYYTKTETDSKINSEGGGEIFLIMNGIKRNPTSYYPGRSGRPGYDVYYLCGSKNCIAWSGGHNNGEDW